MGTERTEDPRTTRTRAAVLEATIELIRSDGPEGVTFQEVARRARVGRGTLYRYWPDPDDLVFDALSQIVSEWAFTGPGRLRDQLVAVIDSRRSELNQPIVRMAFTSVLSKAPRDPAAARMRDRFVGSIASSLRASIKLGEERGELRPGLDAELLSAQVMGAMVWRSFVLGKNVTRDYIERVVDEALDGWELD